MKHWILAAFCCIGTAAIAQTPAAPPAGPPVRATAAEVPPETPFEPHRIAGNLYYVGTKGLGVYLITTAAGHILINGAYPSSVPQILANITANARWAPWTSAWNVTGMPAVSLPLHWTPDGLPVGVMLAARPAEEGLLLALAAQVEAAAPWIGRHPPGW